MMNAVVKPYHEMCLNSSELIVPRDTYQRALHPARVARIAKEFDERVANEPKISFRDGHYLSLIHICNDYIIGSCKYRNEKIGLDELELIREYAAVFGLSLIHI